MSNVIHSFPRRILLLFALLATSWGCAFAQAPNISYQTPQVYTVGTSISQLAPANTGGAVPKIGEVTTLATGFYTPGGLTVDAQNNIFVADENHRIIKKITPGGVISIFAGNGGLGDNDGTGAAASFGVPSDIKMDGAGNFIIPDQVFQNIRKATPSAVVTTLTGSTGTSGQTGLVNGPLAGALFWGPRGVATDAAGNLYIADSQNNAIRKISTTGIVSTFAGTGAPGTNDGPGATATFNQPAALGFDAAGNLYVADQGNFKVRKITPAGIVSTIAGNGTSTDSDGGGQALNAGFSLVLAIAVAPDGNVFVGDESAIRKVGTDGTISMVAGSLATASYGDGAALNARFNGIFGMALDNAGNLYATEGVNNTLRKITFTGYTIDKPLPSGLTFDTETGIISGKPTAASPSTNYTVTANNLSGSSCTIVNITVNAQQTTGGAPNISYQTPQVYTVNTPITALMPKNTGGAVPKNAYGSVSTLAGTGNAGSADGTTAEFNAPRSLSCDGQGNVYVADRDNNKIRMVTPAGNATTIAGSGTAGAANLTGTNATFTGPNGLVVARDGTIYVADSGNALIRKILNNGVVSTYAGSGIPGNADGKQFASFDFPNDVVIDNSGKLYISDYANEEVRTVGTDGVVHTVAGIPVIGDVDGTGPAARFYNPGGLAMDVSGNIIICDVNNNIIRKMTPDSVVSTLAGNGTKGFANGTAASAMFNYPGGVAVDALGNMYITDTFNYLIRKMDASGNVTTLCGLQGVSGFSNGQRETATFGENFGIATDNNGNLYVADGGNNAIRKISLTGYEIDKPLPPGLAFDETTGTISGTPTAPSPSTNYTITAYNLQGSSSTVVNITVNYAVSGTTPPVISYQTPQIYVVGTTIPTLAPTNTGGAVPATIYAQVTTFVGSGAYGYADGTGTAAAFAAPARLAIDPVTDNLYVADRDNNLIRMVTPVGVVTTYAKGFSQPNDIALDGKGNMYVADAASNSIKFVTANGSRISTFAGNNQGFANGNGRNASFYYPYGLGIDATGNLYVADSQNNMVRKIDPSANVTTLAGTGAPGDNNGPGVQATFNDPNSITLDASGNIYVSDSKSNEIRKVTPSGAVSTFVGTGQQGSQNGSSAVATLYSPGSVTFDAAGNTYVSDVHNFLIRKIDKAGNVSTLAGSGTSGTADGVGTNASFTLAYGINYDKAGFLYAIDLGGNNIRKICLTGYIIDKPLPPGLSFDPTTGIISGTPTASFPNTVYTVTAYNVAGSSSTQVNIRVVTPVALATIQTKTTCDADFALNASGGTGSYTYSCNNGDVATVNAAGIVHIVGPGVCTITATDGYSSQQQVLSVSFPVIPTITVDPSAESGCDGMSLTFTATVTNEGTAPAYQWQVNGQSAGTNSNSFTSSTLNNGDIINCILTNTTDCTNGPVTSNNATAILAPYQTPSVTIQSSATGPVSPGTNVIFNATAVNGGTDPVYQWQLNNANVGTNSPTYSNSCLNDGDLVSCTITNQGGKCLTTLTATSNIISVSITTGKFISISAPATTIYQGQSVTFTATTVVQGNSQVFQWQVNATNEGANSSTYTTSALKNGDVVTCVLTDNSCSAPLTSNAITMTVLLPKNVIIPNAFTPNNDGINDKWNIESLATYPNCVVDVFTRYGSAIFHSRGYAQPWDGTFKGSKLPAGTYYYVIDLGNNSPKLSGYVVLIY